MKLDPKQVEIQLHFKNFKKLQDNSFTLQGSNIYFVRAKNGAGKTTFKQGLEALQMAKLDADQPITIGQTEGSIEAINLLGADGKKYTARCEMTQKGTKFIVIDEEGKKISSVTQIRDIFKYHHFTAEEFMQMSLTAKGRDEAKKLFLSLLSEEDGKKYEYASLKEKESYDKRTSLKAQLDQYVLLTDTNKVSAEEVARLASLPVAKEMLAGLEKQIIEADLIKQKIDFRDEQKKELQEKINANNEKIKKLQLENDGFAIQLATLNEDTTEPVVVDEIKARVEKGKVVVSDLEAIEKKKEKFDEYSKLRDEKNKEWKDMDALVEKYRKDQDDIIQTSQMPVKDLRLTDKGLMYGALSFTEAQISKAQAMLIGAEIQCAISDSPILVMGSANDLDDTSLAAMEEIAVKNNRIMIFDEVYSEQVEVNVVGYDHTT